MSEVTRYKVLCDCRVGGFFRRKGEIISLPKADKPFSFLEAIADADGPDADGPDADAPDADAPDADAPDADGPDADGPDADAPDADAPDADAPDADAPDADAPDADAPDADAPDADGPDAGKKDEQPTRKAKKAFKHTITKEDLGIGKPTPSSNLTSSDMVTK